MKISTLIAVIAAIVVVALAAWYWWGHMPLPSGTPAPSGAQTTAGGSYSYIPDNLLLGTDATSSVGTYLIGSSGMTLYTYSKDSSGNSTCLGQCAAVWPPYTIASRDVLANVQAGIGGSVDAIVRADGTMQVTYNGAPLYYYAKDQGAEDINGQGVDGVWFVAKP